MKKKFRVADIIPVLLEGVEEGKRNSKELLEDYKNIKILALKGISEVNNSYMNTKIMNDILEIAKRYAGDESIS
jgi:hypothetical protein